ncbi:hypothetical protein BKA70DRAFT_332091 [Coprinopsis sp. MPI-PUGE-AT-0042]|nr:hypothetical protein BKA70DRAFT_332091 [Coprinopsis sp. MPI-PUGE-AT-0042]
MGNKQSKGQRLGGPEPAQAKAAQHVRSSSKSSKVPKADGKAPVPHAAAPGPASKSAKKGGKALGGSDGGGASVPDPRQAAAEAAEKRMKAEQQRGTNASNPNAGRLAAKVGKAPTKKAPGREEERLVVC